MEELRTAIQNMTMRIAEILQWNIPSVYLHGSVALDDFKIGWSDIDILVLTERTISQSQAKALVTLRQTMLAEYPENPLYRLFEGGMLTSAAFCSGAADTVVYWGTSGERIDTHYHFDSFCLCELLESGILLYGKDVRHTLNVPDYDTLKENVQEYYEAIRKYADLSGRSLYTYGWLLDISRCIYTLRTGKIIAKTAAGEWALKEKLCPCEIALAKAVTVRKNPTLSTQDAAVLDYAETIGRDIQRYADVLEAELKKTPHHTPH